MAYTPDSPTIFIVMSRGFLVRTIVRTGILAELKSRITARYVFVVPPGTPAFLREEINDPDIIFEEHGDEFTSKIRKLFIFFMRFSRITRTGMSLAWEGSGKRGHYRLRYALLFPFFILISCIPGKERIFRFIEERLYVDHTYDALFMKYKPSLVLATNIVGSLDTSFVKAARRFGVRSVAMTKGWDNLDKYRLQVKADKLIVQSYPLVAYAQHYQGYKPEDVFVGGFPTFDVYGEPVAYSRDEVCKKFNLNPGRKILFFGSEGVWSSNDVEIVEKLAGWVRDNAFAEPCCLVIRPHFTDLASGRFDAFRNREHIHVYDQMRTCKDFPDRWYPTEDEHHLFAAVMHALDVMICVRSTLTLDAAMCDKPAVNLTKRAFIADNGRDETMNLYKHTFYRDFLARNSVAMAGSDDEIKAIVNAYLLQPALHRNERAQVRKLYCAEDPKSSHVRIAEFVVSQLPQPLFNVT